MANTKFSDNESLYKRSLIYHLSQLKLDTLYVIKCDEITLPLTIKNYKVVEVKNFQDALKGKESLYAVKVMPFEIKSGDIGVTLIDYVLRDENGEIMMNHTGSSTYVYRYSSKSKQYQLLRRIKNKI